VATPFVQPSTTFTNSGTSTQSITVSLVVDGVVKSTIVAARSTETIKEIAAWANSNGTVGDTSPGILISSTTTDSVTLDGAAPVELSSYGAPNITIPTQAAAAIIINNIRVHTVRYSNNAYGLAAFNLDPSDFAEACYLAGVVNLVTGTKSSAVGYVDETSVEAAYAIQISVEPETGDIATDSGCYV
jgi:hypothetical protein